MGVINTDKDLIRQLEKRVKILKRKIRTWKEIAKDGLPDENRGVLVFIPDEDNHITAGMWDVSKKWVLLDEYREPTVPVTHWMDMPDYPKEYGEFGKYE